MGVHTASVTNYFNRTTRSQRLLISEESYTGGINYTENVLPEGYSKMLVNYMFRDSGASLSPRPGLIDYSDAFDTGITASEDNTLDKAALHYSTYGVYEDKTSTNVYTDMCFSFGRLTGKHYKAYKNMYAMIQDATTKEWRIAKYEGEKDYRIKTRSVTNTVHDFKQCTMYEPICTTYNGKCYVMVKEGTEDSAKYSLARFNIKEEFIKDDEGNDTTETKLVIEIETLSAKETSVTTALSTGFNMLADYPYNFNNKEAAKLEIKGGLPYTVGTNDLFLDARVGDTIDFVMFYEYVKGKAYTIKWEYANADSNTLDYTVIKDTADLTAGSEARLTYAPADESFIIKCTITQKDDATTFSTYTFKFKLGQLTMPMTDKYDLMTAQYMSSHAKMLLLWGVTGAENMLFASGVSQPDYFPFPTNTVTFDEKIVAVEPYLENLIVLTTKKVYLLTFPSAVTTGNILSFVTRTTLHETLGIQDIDAPTVKSISNMVFFRTNNKFYVVTPVARAGVYTLKVIEAKTGIQDFTDKFAERLEKLVYDIWQIEADQMELVKSYTFVDAAQVKILYLVKLKDDLLINVILSYDTVSYVWLMEIHQANYSMVPYKASDLRPILYYTAYKDGENYKARIVGYDEVYKKDTCSLSELNPRVMLNYQYLDTGSRDQDKFHKKRFRELDLNLNNRSGKVLDFALDFRLDGQPRQGTISYSIEHDTDPESPTYGLLTYNKHYKDNISIPGKSVLDVWTLDSSSFPELDKVKVRFKISGKGYYAQYILISKNEEDFEILNHVWVCRPMFAR